MNLNLEIESPQEAHYILNLLQGSVLKNINLTKVNDDIKSDPSLLTRQLIRIKNPSVTGNILVLKVIPTKRKSIVDVVIFPVKSELNYIHTKNYDEQIKKALSERTEYILTEDEE